MFRGRYRVYKSGILVAETPNVITTRGRGIILRYLAGSVGTYAGSIAVGTTTTTPDVANTKLGFEFARGAVNVAAADVPNSLIIFKASLPVQTAGIINEIGLYPYQRQTDTEYFGQIYLGFDEDVEGLTGGGVNTTNYRIGTESYSLNAAAGASSTAVASIARANFGGYGTSDNFSLAYFINDANTASIRVRLYVDATNYFQYSFNPGTAVGYRVTDWNKSAFTATGSPTWENINYAEFTVTAGAGATTVELDGMRVNDTDLYPDYGLVSRAVLDTPLLKLAGEQMDVEYALEVLI